MGNAIIPSSSAITPSREISNTLFMDFIAWIDRGQRTTRGYLVNLHQFIAWLKFSGIARPQRADIIAYKEWLSQEHAAIMYAPETESGWKYRTDHAGNPVRIMCKPSTIRAYLQSVRQFFTWAASNNLYPNIAANIHPPKTTDSHKKDSLTASEVLDIENAITGHAADRQEIAAAAKKDRRGKVQRATEQGLRLRAMYVLAVNAGLRTIEISRANVKDLESKGGKSWLYIWGKGHNEPDQKKPIAREVKAAIDEYLAARTDHPTGNSPLFISTGNRSHGQRIAATTISRMLKKAMQAAGYDSERLTAHSLRHTAGQNVMEITGHNIYTTQLYMRHTSPKTTEIYLENEEAAQNAEIAERLYNRYHGGEQQPCSELEALKEAVAKLTPAQIGQLAKIAEAMA